MLDGIERARHRKRIMFTPEERAALERKAKVWSAEEEFHYAFFPAMSGLTDRSLDELDRSWSVTNGFIETMETELVKLEAGEGLQLEGMQYAKTILQVLEQALQKRYSRRALEVFHENFKQGVPGFLVIGLLQKDGKTSAEVRATSGLSHDTLMGLGFVSRGQRD